MPTRAVVGIYDSLARAEHAEQRLDLANLPMGQMSLLAPRMEDGRLEGEITARAMVGAMDMPAVRLSEEQISEYEEALKEGKFVLVFHGDAEMVDRARQALGDTDNEGLAVLGG